MTKENKTRESINLENQTQESLVLVVSRANGNHASIHMNRASAVETHRRLGEYLERDFIKPAVLWYNSNEGWSWTDQETEVGTGCFSRDEDACRDLESKGYKVASGPLNVVTKNFYRAE